ncbi:MAG: serine O-acetyltransferase [Spongiibacteraceae bacterium]|jgi:serine O-acetyltransferase|nr:serine O-acetyltransferase [Spongiibacteraceae bacterium]
MSDDSAAAPLAAAVLWQRVAAEVVTLAESEPMLASFYHASLLNHGSLASALGFMLATQLGCSDLRPMLIRQVCEEAYRSDPALVESAATDVCAHYDRDPACVHYSTPLLYFKGFHAIQAYRVANWLWRQGRQGLALFLQNRMSIEFDVDIHPAATIGSGVMVDHATGLVIGETAVVGNNVSILHSVSLGGCGRGSGRRHPVVGEGVLLAAGAKLLGPIAVGDGAKIAAGSVVLDDVPAHTTVAGVPAQVVGRPRDTAPAINMDQYLQ